MPNLLIDELTASVALEDLEYRGNDLSILAQAIDEEWKRYASDPALGGRHLISTQGNRQDCPPTGLAYYNTQFLQPGPVRAEERPIEERFLRGKPLLCAEIARNESEYRLQTALLRVSLHVHAVLDWDRGAAVFYLLEGNLPETVMSAAIGRRLGDVVDLGHQGDLIVTDLRTADEAEMRKVLNQIWMPALAIETTLPSWRTVEFEAAYHDVPAWMR